MLHSRFWVDVVVLACFFIFLRVTAFFVLKWRLRRQNWLTVRCSRSVCTSSLHQVPLNSFFIAIPTLCFTVETVVTLFKAFNFPFHWEHISLYSRRKLISYPSDLITFSLFHSVSFFSFFSCCWFIYNWTCILEIKYHGRVLSEENSRKTSQLTAIHLYSLLYSHKKIIKIIKNHWRKNSTVIITANEKDGGVSTRKWTRRYSNWFIFAATADTCAEPAKNQNTADHYQQSHGNHHGHDI